MPDEYESIPEALGRAATEEEYYALTKEEPYELLGGRFVEAPATDRHEALFGFLLVLLSTHLDVLGGAKVLGSRYAMRLDPRWSVEPDVLVVRDENRHRMTERCLEGPADWVIEILSCEEARIEERWKLPRYRAAGIPEIWLVDPFEQTLRAEVRQADGSYAVTTLAGGRLASATLPGFWIDAEWLTRDPLPGGLASFRQIVKSDAAGVARDLLPADTPDWLRKFIG